MSTSVKDYFQSIFGFAGDFATFRLTARRALTQVLFALAGSGLLWSGSSYGAEVTVAWDALADPAVGHYRVFYGENSGNYTESIDVGGNARATIAGLEQGKTYFFNLKAYPVAGALANESAFAGEIRESIPLPPPPPPQAAFSANVTNGIASLTVLFSDQSSGQIDARTWRFGNGVTSSAATAMTNYSEPGSYTVTLTVTGPGGVDSMTRERYIEVLPRVIEPLPQPEPQQPGTGGGTNAADEVGIEVGNLTLTQRWQTVELQNEFIDPVVIAGTLGGIDYDLPGATVRIRAIDADSFQIRAQAWDYLGQPEISGKLSYLVVERGRHTLADGTEFEAGWVDDAAQAHPTAVSFVRPFAVAPVVVSSIAAQNVAAAAVSRSRRVTESGFVLRLQRQEADRHSGTTATVGYIAWEPTVGVYGDWSIEVATTANAVRHDAFPVYFEQEFAAAPSLIAAMQTTGGSDAATVRWYNMDGAGFDVWIEEEQSRDREMRHARESVGYMVFEPLQ